MYKMVVGKLSMVLSQYTKTMTMVGKLACADRLKPFQDEVLSARLVRVGRSSLLWEIYTKTNQFSKCTLVFLQEALKQII